MLLSRPFVRPAPARLGRSSGERVTSRLLPVAIALPVFVLDRLTKIWIENNVSAYDSFHVIPGFFDIVHTKNRGAAFGMFAEGDSPLRTFLLIGVSVAVLVFITVALLRPPKGGARASILTQCGLSLVMGGAIGNIYDRIVHGMVTDFLEFYLGEYRFAAFNVADSAITVGAGLLILDMLWTRKQKNVPEAG
jgi:signal peptidase II